MRLVPISGQITSELKKVEQARKVDTAQKTKAVPADQSDISTGARERLSETQANANVINAQLTNEPEIREDRVAEVRKRIENGYYNSPEFLEKLTDKVINDLGLGEVQK